MRTLASLGACSGCRLGSLVLSSRYQWGGSVVSKHGCYGLSVVFSFHSRDLNVMV